MCLRSHSGLASGSLHGDAFCEVSGLVDVGAFEVGDVVGDELDGDDGEEGLDEVGGVGEGDHDVGEVLEAVVAVGADGDDAAAPGFDLLDVGEGLFVDGVLGAEDHHGELAVDEGDGAVLHLAGGVALGVDVADLFELEGPFGGDGELVAPAQVEEGGGLGVLAGDSLVDVDVLEEGLHVGGDLAEGFDELLGAVRFEAAVEAAQEEGEHGDGGDLGGEGFGAGDADLGAGVGVEDAVGLPGDGGLDDVADADRAGASLLGLPDGGQGVCGLAGLADGDGQGVLGEDGVAVPELAGELGLDGDPGDLFDEVFADLGGEVAGAAGDEDDLVQGGDGVGVEAELGEVDFAAVDADPAAEGVDDAGGLLVDLLEHEVLVALLLGGDGVPTDALDGAVDGAVVGVEDGDLVGPKQGGVAVFEEDEVPGVAQDGGDVAGGKRAAVAMGDDHWRGVSGDEELVGVFGLHDDQGVGALDAV